MSRQNKESAKVAKSGARVSAKDEPRPLPAAIRADDSELEKLFAKHVYDTEKQVAALEEKLRMDAVVRPLTESAAIQGAAPEAEETTVVKRRGRPASKRSDPNYEPVTLLIRKELRKTAERRWEDAGQRHLSNLIEVSLELYTAGALDEMLRQRIETGDKLH